MDIFDCIYTRRSIRKFKDVPVEFDKIIEIMKAGTYAPCAGDLQNWKYLFEYDPDKIKSLYHHTLEQEAFMTAQVAIIVVAETDIAEKFFGMRGKRLYAIQNCAAMIQNMLLAAHALGVGACWIGAFDENRINDMYKIPSVARAQAIILLGYADEVPKQRHVKYVWFLVNYGKYGMKYDNMQRIMHDLSLEWEKQRDILKRMANRRVNEAKKLVGMDKEKTVKSSAKAKGKDMLNDLNTQAMNFFQGLKKGKPASKGAPQRRAAKKSFLDKLKKRR